MEAQTEVTPRDEAIAYARSYAGSWEVMLDIQQRVLRYGERTLLSDRQIAMILGNRERESRWAAERAAKLPLEVGFYLHEGTVFRVQESKSSGHLYAMALTIDEVEKKGRFQYAPGATRYLSADDRLTTEQAAAMGHHYGVCVICGATLTDPESVERGIGPVCIKRIGGAK